MNKCLPSECPSRINIYLAIDTEIQRAVAKHGDDRWSRHEFKGVIDEEYDEMWDAIKKDRPAEELISEIIEVAAMCVRFLETSPYRDALKTVIWEKQDKLRQLGLDV